MLKYRPEIDGFRALAVIPVIFFHAGFEVFSGGYIGVDVFFVISGYLITTILIEDIENDRFNIMHFYERRARRILPALFLVMLVCIPLAWLWMPPDQMKGFSQSLVAVNLFVSNFLFWIETSYFAVAAEQKPLLHTWSLAVEEQYYIFFPLFLLVAWRFGKNKVFWMIVGLAVLSLGLTEWGWRKQASANFYLAPFRIWELLAGSITAFILRDREIQKNNLLATLGLAAIIFAIFVYDRNTPFPSLYGLVPILGTAILIVYADTETVVGKILSMKVFVGIGLISYSAYLWHQPLFAFARIRTFHEVGIFVVWGLISSSFLLAYLSWKFVERPFRNKGIFSSKQIFVYSIIGSIFFLTAGVSTYLNNGFPADDAPESFEVNALERRTIRNRVFLIGDSHARHLFPGFRANINGPVIRMVGSGCIPFRDVDRYDSRSEIGACAKTMNEHIDTLSAFDKRAVVIISSMGPVYLDGSTFRDKAVARVIGQGVKLTTDLSVDDPYDVYEIGMRRTLTELTENRRLKIIFTIDVPELGINDGCNRKGKQINAFGLNVRDLVKNLPADACVIPRAEYSQRSKSYKALVYRVLDDYPTVTLFDPTNYFCNEEICQGFKEGFGYLYRDVDHLSRSGSFYYAQSFINATGLEGLN